MRSRWYRAIWTVAGAALLVGTADLTASQVRSSAPLVVTAHIDQQPIMPPTASYWERALKKAEEEGAACLLVEMDTPGGRDDSMREIVRANLGARVPVVVYVAPATARAASAGAIIAISANLIAMAPNTNIGAAKPVTGEGANLPSDMRDKVMNDMAAFTRSLAQKRGRNPKIAEQMVRSAISLSETEAKSKGFADIIADNRADLLRQLDGRRVQTAAGTRTLHTQGAQMEEIPLSTGEALLLLLFNPNITLLLGAVAFYGIVTEITNPGSVLPGVAGGIALILTLYSFAALSVNMTGALLLVLALALFVIDIFATTHGVLTVGGVVAFVFGALMLFNGSSTGVHVSLSLIVALAILSGSFSFVVVGAAVRSRRRPAGSGPETLIGAVAEARTYVNPTGKVFTDGTFWNAVNVGMEPIQPGDAVVVEGRDGLTLKVRRAVTDLKQ